MNDLLVPNAQLFELTVAEARVDPLEGFVLAAQLDVHKLAIMVCWRYLMSTHFATLDFGMADRMGGIYVKRLAVLLDARMDHLKNMVFIPPAFHDPSPYCYIQGQGKLMRVWSLAVAQLGYEATPGMWKNHVDPVPNVTF